MTTKAYDDAIKALRTAQYALAHIALHGHRSDYDWNADPKHLTRVEGEVFDAIEAVLTAHDAGQEG